MKNRFIESFHNDIKALFEADGQLDPAYYALIAPGLSDADTGLTDDDIDFMKYADTPSKTQPEDIYKAYRYKDLFGKKNDVEECSEPKKEGIAGSILGGAAGAAIGHPILGAAAGSIAQDALLDDEVEDSEEPKQEGLAGAIVGGGLGAMVGHPIIGAAAGSLAQDAFIKKGK